MINNDIVSLAKEALADAESGRLIGRGANREPLLARAVLELSACLAQPHMEWAADQHSVGVDIADEDVRLRAEVERLRSLALEACGIAESAEDSAGYNYGGPSPRLAEIRAEAAAPRRRATSSAVPRETQASIEAWRVETFGPSKTTVRMAARANEEMAELLRALTVDDANPAAASECADVVIVLYGVASRLGVDLFDEVDKAHPDVFNVLLL